jgi:aryl-alcohol dehydrogenase-like predicted oxidoreductase
MLHKGRPATLQTDSFNLFHALNYSINKGVLPLVGVRDAGQAEQDMQALGWRLTRQE